MGKDWQVSPAGGATGEAYVAQHGNEKLFLKRNSSPFLAVLSAEGIVPKLLWTKRLGNGDVITAQQWLNGRELKALDMGDEKVAALLRKIHRSQELLGMLKRLGKQPLSPMLLLEETQKDMSLFRTYPAIIKENMAFLMEQAPRIDCEEKVVCHCDVNHNNWLLSDEGNLFLIDWDGAMIADPALDIGMMLYSYIPHENWSEWLHTYGIKLTQHLKERMHWYVTAHTIHTYFWHMKKGQLQEAARWENNLEQLAVYKHSAIM